MESQSRALLCPPEQFRMRLLLLLTFLLLKKSKFVYRDNIPARRFTNTSLVPTSGTQPHQSQLHRLCLKTGCSRCRTGQPDSSGQIEIDKLSTSRADRMVMPLSFAIVTARAIAKCNFSH